MNIYTYYIYIQIWIFKFRNESFFILASKKMSGPLWKWSSLCGSAVQSGRCINLSFPRGHGYGCLGYINNPFTPPKFNIAPKKWWLEVSFWNCLFLGAMLNFWGVNGYTTGYLAGEYNWHLGHITFSHLKMNGWKTNSFPFGARSIFRCELSVWGI